MMAKRVYVKGGTYFFTVNLFDRKKTLLVDEFTKLRQSILITAQNHPFKICALVILPEHFHMIMVLPEFDLDFSTRIKSIKSHFSRQIEPTEAISDSRKRRGERSIWQRRFWEHLIRDETDLEHHINYIHYNPVKHGYVQSPTDWVYSTIHSYVKKGNLSRNWGDGDVGSGRDYGE